LKRGKVEMPKMSKKCSVDPFGSTKTL